jgi:hypothetical protein
MDFIGNPLVERMYSITDDELKNLDMFLQSLSFKNKSRIIMEIASTAPLHKTKIDLNTRNKIRDFIFKFKDICLANCEGVLENIIVNSGGLKTTNKDNIEYYVPFTPDDWRLFDGKKIVTPSGRERWIDMWDSHGAEIDGDFIRWVDLLHGHCRLSDGSRCGKFLIETYKKIEGVQK